MVSDSFLSGMLKVRDFDLNLLLTFEAVYFHKSVTKAANFMDVTPSAVSQALTKLRFFFGDPLFIREKNGLAATTVAVNLHTKLSKNINPLLESINSFPSMNEKSRFVIHAAPYLALRIIPDFYSVLQENKINCEIIHMNADVMLENTEDILTYRKADVVFDTKPYYSSSTVCEAFLIEQTVAVCSKEHPRLGLTLNKEEMKLEKSTFLSTPSEDIKKFQYDALSYFEDRDILFSSHSFIVIAGVIEKTDLVGFVPSWFARKFMSSFNIKILECLFISKPITFYMTYNKSSLKDENFKGLISLLQEIKKS
ncbi:LysR family transcriptional regulator [Buttiauxella izardii]|uniref:LysR family transcriptional regulator n=1 Tax=Buttiauxella izardii TaxID=82991 RepID=A0A3A5JQR4_9ENTR|nr:LysR family transcriptional regulator [Buttiauxella izardii]RJT21012.1 LysR family transcriptional regulator [Buttiauxella izardii]